MVRVLPLVEQSTNKPNDELNLELFDQESASSSSEGIQFVVPVGEEEEEEEHREGSPRKNNVDNSVIFQLADNNYVTAFSPAPAANADASSTDSKKCNDIDNDDDNDRGNGMQHDGSSADPTPQNDNQKLDNDPSKNNIQKRKLPTTETEIPTNPSKKLPRDGNTMSINNGVTTTTNNNGKTTSPTNDVITPTTAAATHTAATTWYRDDNPQSATSSVAQPPQHCYGCGPPYSMHMNHQQLQAFHWNAWNYFWFQSYQALKEYKEIHGTVDVPMNFIHPTVGSLHEWIHHQRILHQQNSLLPKSFELLCKLGVDLSVIANESMHWSANTTTNNPNHNYATTTISSGRQPVFHGFKTKKSKRACGLCRENNGPHVYDCAGRGTGGRSACEFFHLNGTPKSRGMEENES